MGTERQAFLSATYLAALPLALLAASVLTAAIMPFHCTALSFTAVAAMAGLFARSIGRAIGGRQKRFTASTLLVLGCLAAAGIGAWLLVGGAG